RDAGAPPPAVTRSARRKAEHPLAGQTREFRPARCPLEGKRRRGTEALTRGAAYAPNSGTSGQAGPRAAAPEIRGGIDAVVRCRWGRGARPSRTAIAGAGIAPRSRPLGLRPPCQSVRAAATGNLAGGVHPPDGRGPGGRTTRGVRCARRVHADDRRRARVAPRAGAANAARRPSRGFGAALTAARRPSARAGVRGDRGTRPGAVLRAEV